MLDEIRFVEETLGQRFEGIASDTSTAVLRYPGHLISSRPMQSSGYANCCSVVLLAPGTGGFSHYDLETGIPEVYVPLLIREIKRFNECQISAVVIGGDSSHLHRSKDILSGEEIPIVGEYCDGWGDEDHAHPFGNMAEKHVLIIPEFQEVIVYSKPIGYRQLYRR